MNNFKEKAAIMSAAEYFSLVEIGRLPANRQQEQYHTSEFFSSVAIVGRPYVTWSPGKKAATDKIVFHFYDDDMKMYASHGLFVAIDKWISNVVA